MSARAQAAYFVRTALGSMARSPFVHVIAVASLALALFGYGVARLASGQLDALVHALGGEVEFTVYLAEDAPDEQVAQLEAALLQRTGGTAQRVSPAEALGRLAAGLGDHGRALAELTDNPLPWSLELKLPVEAREPAALADLAARVRQLPFVADVDYGAEALERLTLLSRGLRLAMLVAFALVFLTTVIIVSATLQLAIFARRDEIEIQKLVGATDRFVRVPFLLEGMLQGLAGGALALLAAFLATRLLAGDSGQAVAFLRLSGGLSVDWGRLALEQVSLGVALGLLGSFVAVARFLRV